MTSRSLIRVAPDGSRTTIASAELPRPENQVFDVSINSTSIGSGQVLRIEP